MDLTNEFSKLIYKQTEKKNDLQDQIETML